MISVIIPVYNREKYISKCLDSVLDSIYSDFEIIIVNDGSSDKSLQICKKYETKDKRIKVINQSNHGVSYARNVGLKYAKGEWVIFIDSDDTISNEFFSDLEKEEYEKYDVIFWGDDENYDFNCKDVICDLVTGNNKIFLSSPWSKVYKRKLLINNNIKFNNNLKIGEDLLFNLEVVIKSKNLKYIHKKVYYTTVSDNSLMHSFHKDYIKNDIEFQTYMKQIMVDNNILKKYKDVYYNNVVNSIYILCYKYIFNRDNEMSFKNKKIEFNKILNHPIYKTALENNCVRYSKKNKILIFLFKHSMFNTIYFLLKIKNRI